MTTLPDSPRTEIEPSRSRGRVAVVASTMDRAKVVEGGVANIDLMLSEGLVNHKQNI